MRRGPAPECPPENFGDQRLQARQVGNSLTGALAERTGPAQGLAPPARGQDNGRRACIRNRMPGYPATDIGRYESNRLPVPVKPPVLDPTSFVLSAHDVAVIVGQIDLSVELMNIINSENYMTQNWVIGVINSGLRAPSPGATR